LFSGVEISQYNVIERVDADESGGGSEGHVDSQFLFNFLIFGNHSVLIGEIGNGNESRDASLASVFDIDEILIQIE